MKQHAHFYVLSACILIAAAMLCLSLGRPGTQAQNPPAAVPEESPAAAYRLEKLNKVNDMVLEREIVDEDYLYYLSENEALCGALRDYNQQTAEMGLNYTQDAIGIVNSLFYEHTESPGDYAKYESIPYYEWIGRIARLALHSNCEQMCYTDPYLSYPLAQESGGSYGIWAYRMHISTPERQEQSEAYFAMIDSLLVQLDEYRQSLS